MTLEQPGIETASSREC